jgi:hypothetical protein
LSEIQYLDGNVNNAVVVHGDDPTNKENVLVTRLGASESVLKDSVTDLNEHVVNEADQSASQSTEDKDAEIASLKKQLSDAEGNG